MNGVPLQLSLLVVDDDDVDRERVLRMLSGTPLKVQAKEASDSKGALSLLRQYEFDCVVLDNQLGDASGAELLPAIHREAIRDCPVIMITGAGNEALAVQALQQGAADYLTKYQLDASTLVRAIRRALEHHRMRSELDELHKHLEQRVQELAALSDAVFEHSPVGLAVFDSTERCVMANPALSALAGGPYRPLVGSGLERMAGSNILLLQAARQTAADGEPRRADAQFGDGGTAALVSCALARFDLGGHDHLLLLAQDVTEQRNAHEALLAARNAAESASRAKAAFLANMSHEIRTPMNAVIGLTRLALEDALPPAARDYLDKVHTSALALMGILDDVLDYSKIEAGQMRFERVPFELESIVQRVVDLFGARVEQKGLELVIDLAPNLPRHVIGDALRLSQVLTNLVGNAVKFTEHGHVMISVSWVAQQAGCLRFVVQDTGVGVPAQHQDALFQAFAQGDESITRRYGGTGLGLAISRRLVAMMEGKVGVDSRAGEGSTFWFTAHLPAATVEPDGNRGSTVDGIAGVRALLVEGHAELAAALTKCLRARGVEVTCATEAVEGARICQAADRTGQPFGVVLMDWNHAGVEGLEAARCIKSSMRGPAVPLIALAGLGARGQIAQYDPSEVPEAVVVKPVLPRALLDALASVIASGPVRHDAETPARHPGSPIPGRGLLNGTTILVVEDGELNRIVAQEFLRHLGANVVLAVNGEDAVAVMAGAPWIDAILMDLQMPGMDGLEATRCIRAMPHGQAVPIIGLTAAALQEDRLRCKAAGMSDHLPKPIVMEQLLATLSRHLRIEPKPAGGN